ncbi:hypothetical protein RchiOBHm_Chr2g0168201 [Rosa chinensis]|uniref:Uncharacterized protein n=1 Tax=Rosa chinensis TaxID=74649 RepID=A0A2P6S4J1_ROSCH|nr:hypothetical protein RchiOBHm_Chr2g0168201 [Rosa chinensis]
MTLGLTIQAFSKHFLISIILSVLLLQRFYRKCKFYGSCFRIGKRRCSIILVSYLQSLLGYWWLHHLGYVLKNILKM